MVFYILRVLDVLQSIMPFISDEYGIPIIYISFDAEDNEVGVDTRLEAFYDMIKMKRKQT